MSSRRKGTGTIFRMKGSRFWWIAYYSGGKRHHQSSGSERKADAQAMLTCALGETQRGIVVTPKLGTITIGEGLKAHVNKLKMNDRKSVKKIQGLIDNHILRPKGYFNPDRRLSTVTTSDLTAYMAHRLEEGAAPATANQDMAAIRRAFRLAVKGQELAGVPDIPMLTGFDNVRTGFFERAQFEAVRKELSAPLRPLVTFVFWTGWRGPSEVQTLQWSQVDRHRKVIRLEKGTTKNGEGRTLPYALLPELVETIDEQWREHERLKSEGIISPFVFQRKGKQIRDYYTAWRSACRRAGCPGRMVHDFRRTAVRSLIRAGVPEKQAMGVTGHKTRAVFDRYDIVNEADLRAALGKLATAAPADSDDAPGVVRQGTFGNS